MSAQHHTAPPAAEGAWDLTIDTPIGKQHSRVMLSRTADGIWRGTARDRASGEEVPLTEVVVEGDEVTWRQSITKPLRLHLTVRLTLSGDELAGKAKAGRLPASKVTGRRAADTGTNAGAGAGAGASAGAGAGAGADDDASTGTVSTGATPAGAGTDQREHGAR